MGNKTSIQDPTSTNYVDCLILRTFLTALTVKTLKLPFPSLSCKKEVFCKAVASLNMLVRCLLFHNNSPLNPYLVDPPCTSNHNKLYLFGSQLKNRYLLSHNNSPLNPYSVDPSCTSNRNKPYLFGSQLKNRFPSSPPQSLIELEFKDSGPRICN